MIDITGTNLIEFAKRVYELSVPQGMGFLHYVSTPLTDDEAKQFVHEGNVALDMDYVKGRACKMIVGRKNGKLEIANKWYDHTDKIFKELLKDLGIKPSIAETEHNIACNCIDCQSAKAL